MMKQKAASSEHNERNPTSTEGGQPQSIAESETKDLKQALIETIDQKSDATPKIRSSLRKKTDTLTSSANAQPSQAISSSETQQKHTKKKVSLRSSLASVRKYLKRANEEEDLTANEVELAVEVFKELKRILSPSSRNDVDAIPVVKETAPFKKRYDALLQEFHEAESSQYVLETSHPAFVRQVSLQGLQDVHDFFILDNSLREVTLGAPQAHTLQEKKNILDAVVGSGLKEVALGSFGRNFELESSVMQHYKMTGGAFSSAWGFSDAYDFHASEEGLFDFRDFCKKEKQGADLPELFTPPSKIQTRYSFQDKQFLNGASKHFDVDAFRKKSLDNVIRDSESKRGRIPMGCLVATGYGFSNIILEIDAAMEAFDYAKNNIAVRLAHLIKWCKKNMAKRLDLPTSKDPSPRVLVNFRDFPNWRQSRAGLEIALQVVDELSRLPEEYRPFGFMVEETTNYLFPNEVARLVRMMRLIMDRAGFNGRLLIHQHQYFGLAEASVLEALCNGGDGVWAALCKVGAQVGHASSTVTAVNLYRAGNKNILRKYNLRKMCKAARIITELTTRQPCPEYEEVYGAKAFDIPFFMTTLPSCRYSVMVLIAELGIHERIVRLNEHSQVSSVYNAMVSHFGPPNESGWDPQYCEGIHRAIRDNLLSGLSRNYNTTTGLGHLYQLVSREPFSPHMIEHMMECSQIPDHHPAVVEFVSRWSRLCSKYEGAACPLPGADSRSIMVLSKEAVWRPKLLVLPFEYLHADILQNNASRSIPRLFQYQVLTSLTKQEQERQALQTPEVFFYDLLARLKLFLEEAPDLGVLPLVDDFCLRYSRDYMMGDQVILGRKSESNVLLETHLAVFSRFYRPIGDNAMNRLVASTETNAEMRSPPTFVSMKADLERRRHSTAELSVTQTHEEMIHDLIHYEGGRQEEAHYGSESNVTAALPVLLPHDHKLNAEIVVEEESSVISSASEVSDVSGKVRDTPFLM